MSDIRKDDRHKKQLVRVALYLSIALISIYYTKMVYMDKTAQSKSAVAENDGEEKGYELGAGDDFVNESGKEGDSKGLKELDRIITVPFISQESYPTGCESVTSVMALIYAGIDITVDEFIDQYLKIGEYYKKDERYYGNSPYCYFIGDPRGNGFGCFAPVIHDALVAAVGGDKVKDLTGMTLQNICSEYIENGIPVILWATIGMQPSYEGRRWTLLETGKEYTWPAEEHCLLLVGVDCEYYYFNDPLQKIGGTKCEKTVVEERYREMGKQALAILPVS